MFPSSLCMRNAVIGLAMRAPLLAVPATAAAALLGCTNNGPSSYSDKSEAYVGLCKSVASGSPFVDFTSQGGKCPAAEDCYLVLPPTLADRIPHEHVDIHEGYPRGSGKYTSSTSIHGHDTPEHDGAAHLCSQGRCEVGCVMWLGDSLTEYRFTADPDGTNPRRESCISPSFSEGSATCIGWNLPPSVDASGNPRPDCAAWGIPLGGVLGE